MAKSPPETWPDALLMLGDQIYADDLSPAIKAGDSAPSSSSLRASEWTWWGLTAMRRAASEGRRPGSASRSYKSWVRRSPRVRRGETWWGARARGWPDAMPRRALAGLEGGLSPYPPRRARATSEEESTLAQSSSRHAHSIPTPSER